METHITRITTDDTKKTYEFVDGKAAEGTPMIYKLEIRVSNPTGMGGFSIPQWVTAYLYVEHDSLVRTGHFVPQGQQVPQVTESWQDLVLRLLDLVGVRPTE